MKQAGERDASGPVAGARAPCSAVAKSGAACRHRAEVGSDFCLWHDPARESERRAELSARGRSGRAKRAARERSRRSDVAAVVRLETAAQVREAVERSLAEVEECSAPAPVKAHAVARLASVALDIIRTAEVEKELEELRELVFDRWPEARAKLGRLNA